MDKSQLIKYIKKNIFNTTNNQMIIKCFQYLRGYKFLIFATFLLANAGFLTKD